MSAELCGRSLAEIGALIGRREVSAVETTQAVLARIERLEPDLNAFVTVTVEAALNEARAADEAIGRGERIGPLHGVPISLKDLLFTKGVRTTGSSDVLAEFVPERDATLVRHLRAAGAVGVGKTNMLEFAFGEVHPSFGPTHNPWNLPYATSGSSSGSAAAVAAGLGYGSVGSDTGGSIRDPAAYCGIVGLKPTYDLVSRDGVLPLSWSLDHVGPMTRTVRDSAIMLDALIGNVSGEGGYAAAVAAGDERPRVVGVVGPDEGDGVAAEVRRTVDHAAAVARDLGCDVREVALPHAMQACRAVEAMIYAEASTYHQPWLRSQPEKYAPGTRERLEIGSFLPATVFPAGGQGARGDHRGVPRPLPGDRFPALACLRRAVLRDLLRRGAENRLGRGDAYRAAVHRPVQPDGTAGDLHPRRGHGGRAADRGPTCRSPVRGGRSAPVSGAAGAGAGGRTASTAR